MVKLNDRHLEDSLESSVYWPIRGANFDAIKSKATYRLAFIAHPAFFSYRIKTMYLSFLVYLENRVASLRDTKVSLHLFYTRNY